MSKVRSMLAKAVLMSLTLASGIGVARAETVITVTQYSYDADGRPLCTTVRMNPATYGNLPADACTQGAAGSDGPDRITENTYDPAGQVLQIQKGVGTPLVQNYVTYTYTPNGKQDSVVDANGNKASFTYDGYDRLIQWNFPSKTSAGTVSPTDYESYTYDANGNRLSLTKRDRSSVISYTYDALNRVTLKTEPGASIYYGYDLQGHQLYARSGSASGAGLTQTFNALGRLTSSSNNLSGTALALGYQWDAAGNRKQLTYPDGTYFTYDYDAQNRQKAIHENGGAIVATVTYDDQGRRSGDTRGLVSSSYGYDPISRPMSLSDTFVSTADDVTSHFAYNSASQITSRSMSNPGYAFTGYVNVGRSYTVNGLNQYMAAGPASFAYDANGNLTSDGSSTYIYDVENRLTARSGGLAIAYDPSGRLWQTSGGASGTTRYLYDGDELVAEYGGSGNVLRRYVHGPAADDPILWYEGSGLSDRRSLQIDWQGSIVSVANAAGSVIAKDAYDEYGIPASTNIGRFQYTGQAWLPDLGMYYYKARIYSPTLGRFLQTDPIGYKDQINLYAYVGNDPINGRDPTGTQEIVRANPGDSDEVSKWKDTVNKTMTEGLGKAEVKAWELTTTVVTTALGGPEVGGEEVIGDIVVTATVEKPGFWARVGSFLSRTFGGGSKSSRSLAEARGARDALSERLASAKRPPATVTGGYNVETGEVAARACGGGKCAEDHVVDALGGQKGNVRFTEAVRPRTGREVPVCPRCESSYGREAFPKGTRFQNDE